MRNNNSYELIKALSSLFGPSGSERFVRGFIETKLKELGINGKADKLGNLIVELKSGKPDAKKLMLSAHTDEVGFMITEICDNGYLKIDTVGGISPEVVAGRHVNVLGKNDLIYNGIISSKAIHHKSREDRLKPEKIKNLYVDIGAKDGDEAKEICEVGDYITFAPNFKYFGKDNRFIASKALDDRLGCALLIELIEKLKDKGDSLPLDLYFCFTTREEVGISGATVAANVIRPDYAVVLETTAVSDIAGVPESQKVAKLGEGGVISLMDRSTIYDRELVDLMLEVAKKNGIKAQIKKYVSGGNDAGHIHKSTTGVRTLALSAPTRYLHSPNCVASLDDYDAMLELLYKFILTEKLK